MSIDQDGYHLPLQSVSSARGNHICSWGFIVILLHNMSQSRMLYAPEEVPKVDWKVRLILELSWLCRSMWQVRSTLIVLMMLLIKVLPYISIKWGTGCNDNYAGREALRFTKYKFYEPVRTKTITMQPGIKVQRAKEVSKDYSKMTKGRKKFEEGQLNQSLENTREDENSSENFKRHSTSPWKTGEMTKISVKISKGTQPVLGKQAR